MELHLEPPLLYDINIQISCCISARYHIIDIAWLVVPWQFQRRIPLLGIVLLTHMLRAFGTVSLIKFVSRSHLQFSRNISKLSCSIINCFDCFPNISAIIFLLFVSFLGKRCGTLCKSAISMIWIYARWWIPARYHLIDIASLKVPQ